MANESLKMSIRTFKRDLAVYGFVTLIMLIQATLIIGSVYVIVHFAQKYW